MISNQLSSNDSKFLSYLRGLSIFVIVFGHVGGFWVFQPYSEFLHVFVPIFFFISGAVNFFSFNRSTTTKEYYLKRFLGLLIPYYLLCILSLLVFVSLNRYLPSFEIENVLKWVQIRPSKSIMPFPVGQVWFLHTLFFITLISPLYFFLQKKNELILFLIMGIMIIFSGTQLLFDIDNFFIFMGNNLYKPIVHSSFYIYGIIYFNSIRIHNLKFMVIFFVFSLLSSFYFVYFFNLNINYEFHTYAPDLYYVLGSFSAISFLLIFQETFLTLVKYNKYIERIFIFFNKHTFSIFLLHSFSIYIYETIPGLLNRQEKTIIYGIIKLVVVLTATCILAVPFTRLSSTITAIILKLNFRSHNNL